MRQPLVLTLVLATCLPAQAESQAASALTQMGLIGEWSRDCGSEDVRWQIFIDQSGEAFNRLYEQSSGNTLAAAKITAVQRLGDETFLLDVERTSDQSFGQARYAIWGNSLRLIEYRGGLCVDAVRDGRTASGDVLPALNRCDGGR